MRAEGAVQTASGAMFSFLPGGAYVVGRTSIGGLAGVEDVAGVSARC